LDLRTKTDKELDRWIDNYEAKPGATALQFYRELLEERGRRSEAKPGLKLERSLAHLKHAATQQVCTTYGDLAKASGVDWAKARRQMSGAGGHLDRLSIFATSVSCRFLLLYVSIRIELQKAN
jgi:hypothetical protein